MKVNRFFMFFMMLVITQWGYAFMTPIDGIISIYNESDVPVAVWFYANIGSGDNSYWSGVVQPKQLGGFAYKKNWSIKEVTVGYYKSGTVMINNQPPAATTFLYGTRRGSALYPGDTLPADKGFTPLGISVPTTSAAFTAMPTAIYVYGVTQQNGVQTKITDIITSGDGKQYPACYFAWWKTDIDLKKFSTVAEAQVDTNVNASVVVYAHAINGTKYDLLTIDK